MSLAVLEDLPFLPRSGATKPLLSGGTAPDGAHVGFKKYQTIIWVSLANPGQTALPSAALRFPAVLDIGNTHNFLIQEAHLRTWTTGPSFDPRALASMAPAKLDTSPLLFLPVLDCDVWLHRNVPFERDQFRGAPFPLRLTGVVYSPSQFGRFPRLPVLGLRALVSNRLQLFVDGGQELVSLTAP